MKLHQKGFLLVELSHAASLWDQDLIARAMHEYALSGRYWVNSLRIALDELAAAGLILRLDAKLGHGTNESATTLLFCYSLSDFGHTRMRDTGLM